MKWYTIYIISFIAINAWVWAGTAALKSSPQSQVYMNMSQIGSGPQNVMNRSGFFTGNITTGEYGPNQPQFMTINKTAWQAFVTFDLSALTSLAGNAIAGYISGIQDYVKNQFGWIQAVAEMTGGFFTIASNIGIPQPWAGILTGIWSLLFIFALIGLVTGRDV